MSESIFADRHLISMTGVIRWWRWWLERGGKTSDLIASREWEAAMIFDKMHQKWSGGVMELWVNAEWSGGVVEWRVEGVALSGLGGSLARYPGLQPGL